MVDVLAHSRVEVGEIIREVVYIIEVYRGGKRGICQEGNGEQEWAHVGDPKPAGQIFEETTRG